MERKCVALLSGGLDSQLAIKMMQEQGIDPSQLGGMGGLGGGLPGMSPNDLEALMGSGQPLTKLNPKKSKKSKQPKQSKQQRRARGKRR